MFGAIAFSIFVLFIVLILTVKDKARPIVAKSFLALVLGFLALAGIMAMFTGIVEALRGRMDALQLLIQIPAGLVLAASGGIPLYFLFVSGEAAKRRFERRKARHPNAPWMWVKEWSEGRLVWSPKGQVSFVWFVLIVMTAGLLTVSYLNRHLIRSKLEDSPLEVVGFYAIFGGIMLVGFLAAVQLLRGFLKFGGSTFELSGPCGVVGGELLGRIHTGIKETPSPKFDLQLRCKRRSVGGTHDEAMMWHDDKEVPPGEAGLGPDGLMIPVRFSIPADASESDPWSPEWRIDWTLTASSSIGGRLYLSEFTVPVFRTPEA